MDIGLLILRLTLGLTLAAHGTQKLFGWFGRGELDATGHFTTTLGFPLGRLHAVAGGLAETCGGLLVALGLFTPLGATTLIAVMVAAIFTLHIDKGFFAERGGAEYNIVVAAAALTLAFVGPGSLSFDAVLGYVKGMFWGTAELIVGVAGGIIPLLERRVLHGPAAMSARQ